LLALVLAVALPAFGAGERPLSLEEAILGALEKNEAIVIERESLESAKAAANGAKGAYDPLLSLRSDWERANIPVNSAFSGVPPGQAPTTDSTGAAASVSQLLPTGGSVKVATAASRATTDNAFALLSPAYSTQVGVEARQPLLRDRAIDPARAAIKVAALDQKRATASLKSEINRTLALVERAYWALVAARRSVTVQEEAVKLATAQLEETRIRIENGALPKNEIAQPQAELERRRGELYASHESVARAEIVLKLLILGDADPAWSEGLVPSDDPGVEVTPVDVGEAMQHALASRPEMEESQATLEQRKTETALAKNAIHPSLDLVASYYRYGLAGQANPSSEAIPGLHAGVPDGLEGGWSESFDQLGSNRFDDARVGVQFMVPLGNRAAKGAAEVASSSARQADADLSRTRKAVRAEVLDAAAGLETAGERIEASKAAREAAEVQLSSEIDRYAAGLSTNFLVLTRQNDLSRARLDEIAALTDYRMARTEMGRATGSLLEDRHIEIDEKPEAGR
jgi:HAE1 family hydrophobic/amphiphilic exporter-1